MPELLFWTDIYFALPAVSSPEASVKLCPGFPPCRGRFFIAHISRRALEHRMPNLALRQTLARISALRPNSGLYPDCLVFVRWLWAVSCGSAV